MAKREEFFNVWTLYGFNCRRTAKMFVGSILILFMQIL